MFSKCSKHFLDNKTPEKDYSFLQCKDFPIKHFVKRNEKHPKHYFREFTDTRSIVVSKFVPPEIVNLIMKFVYEFEFDYYLCYLKLLWNLQDNIRHLSIQTFYDLKPTVTISACKLQQQKRFIEFDLLKTQMAIGFSAVNLYFYNRQKFDHWFKDLTAEPLILIFPSMKYRKRIKSLLFYVHFSFIDYSFSFIRTSGKYFEYNVYI